MYRVVHNIFKSTIYDHRPQWLLVFSYWKYLSQGPCAVYEIVQYHLKISCDKLKKYVYYKPQSNYYKVIANKPKKKDKIKYNHKTYPIIPKEGRKKKATKCRYDKQNKYMMVDLNSNISIIRININIQYLY